MTGGPAGSVALGGRVRAWWTGGAEGDQRSLGTGPPPASWGLPVDRVLRPRQVHGGRVVVVGTEGAAAGDTWDGRPPPPEADALVARAPGPALAVLTADCAALALAAGDAYAAVHAGWRGLEAEVVERAVAVVGELGGGPVVAGLGPCVHPCCYEFDPAGIDALAAGYGDVVRATSRRGRPALDLAAGVRAALAGAGARLVAADDRCTGCGAAGAYSHRVRGDEARHALVVWAAP